jgi:hypothetical protein
MILFVAEVVGIAAAAVGHARVIVGVQAVAVRALAFGALAVGIVGIVGVVVLRDVARLVNIDSPNTLRMHNKARNVVFGGELFALYICTCGRSFVCSSRWGRY